MKKYSDFFNYKPDFSSESTCQSNKTLLLSVFLARWN